MKILFQNKRNNKFNCVFGIRMKNRGIEILNNFRKLNTDR